jgi:chromosome segregation ATPase
LPLYKRRDKKINETAKEDAEAARAETEKKLHALLEENGRLKEFEATATKLMGQVQPLEAIVAELRQSLKEKETTQNSIGVEAEELRQATTVLQEELNGKDAKIQAMGLQISALENVR